MAAEPFLVQLMTVETYNPDKGKGVVASYEDAAGGLVWSVEMGHACQEPLAAIAIAGIVAPAAAVVPVERACGLTAIARVPVRIIEYGMHGLASAAIKHGEPFLSTDDASVAIPIEGRATDALDDIISSGLVYIPVFAVFRAWACLAHQFCPSVTIEIVDHILCVVGTRTDVASQIDAPEQLSAQLVAIDEHIVGYSALRIILGVRRVPLYKDLVHTVAIDIPYRTVIRLVIAAILAFSRPLQVEFQISVAPRPDSLGGVCGHAIHQCHHLIDVGRLARLVAVVGGIAVASYALPVTQHLKGGSSIIVCTKESPADEISRCGRQGHHPPIQFLH